jgi:hypothetical protein
LFAIFSSTICQPGSPIDHSGGRLRWRQTEAASSPIDSASIGARRRQHTNLEFGQPAAAREDVTASDVVLTRLWVSRDRAQQNRPCKRTR